MIFASLRSQRAARKAARGAGRLDRAQYGWAQRVDPARLNVTSTLSCPLGQVYGNYYDSPSYLRAHATRDGFFPFLGSAALNEAWVSEVAKRRAG